LYDSNFIYGKIFCPFGTNVIETYKKALFGTRIEKTQKKKKHRDEIGMQVLNIGLRNREIQ